MAVRHSDFFLYSKLWRQAKPYRAHLGAVAGLSLLASALNLLMPLPLKIGVDSVLGNQPLPGFLAPLQSLVDLRSDTAQLVLAAVLLVFIGGLAQILAHATALLSTYTSEKLVLGFRAALFGHAQRLSLAYHDSKGTTDSTYRIQYDAQAIQWIMVECLIPLFAATLTLVTMIYVTLQISWQLALVALAVCPVLFFLTKVFGSRLRAQANEMKNLESSAMSVVQEVLAAVRVVKAFGVENREEERFVSHSRQGLRAKLRLLLVSSGLGLLVGLVMAVGTAAVLYFGVRQVQAGTLTLGDLLVVMAYLAQVYAPLETMSKTMANLQGSLACADRAFALLDEEHDVAERPDSRPLARARGDVAFRHVCFAYEGRPEVLHDISFGVRAGSWVGIAGKTGAGKTSLVSLLTRFYDPTGGQILLDGVDLRDCRLADLRNQFALVLQDAVLFSTSIAENIAYARPGASEAEIVAAAQAANAHEFIAALPAGYDTRVGERGMRLSGGERQRLALARAFLKDAPLLILDEPTSAVDVKTETLIMEALKRLMRGRTTFMIAHRLSTLEACDVRLHLDSGRLVAGPLPYPPPVPGGGQGGGAVAAV